MPLISPFTVSGNLPTGTTHLKLGVSGHIAASTLDALNSQAQCMAGIRADKNATLCMQAIQMIPPMFAKAQHSLQLLARNRTLGRQRTEGYTISIAT
jgi:hypothetical protein